jgi:hypothetical protein
MDPGEGPYWENTPFAKTWLGKLMTINYWKPRDSFTNLSGDLLTENQAAKLAVFLGVSHAMDAVVKVADREGGY